METVECERRLLLRDFSGALDAATRHIESPSLVHCATRERALAVAVQAVRFECHALACTSHGK